MVNIARDSHNRRILEAHRGIPAQWRRQFGDSFPVIQPAA